jgi:hypothetical protein
MLAESANTPVEETLKVLKNNFKTVTKKYSATKGGKTVHQVSQILPLIPDHEWPDKSLNDPEREAKLFLSIPILRNYQESDDLKDKQDRQVYK